MRFTLLPVAGLILLAAFAGEANAAETPADCATAYFAADSERGRLQAASFNNEQTDSLLNLIDNYRDVDFRQRARDVDQQVPSGIGLPVPIFDAVDVAKEMMAEGFLTYSSVLLGSTNPFALQRDVLARVRACDMQFGSCRSSAHCRRRKPC
jgi:hypothetical protein